MLKTIMGKPRRFGSVAQGLPRARGLDRQTGDSAGSEGIQAKDETPHGHSVSAWGLGLHRTARRVLVMDELHGPKITLDRVMQSQRQFSRLSKSESYP